MIIKSFKQFIENNSLPTILIVAALFRLLAVFFSKGYGMHDDHFLVIEAAQSWVDGADYNDWLPSATNKISHPSGHSLLYPGLHYLLFKMLQFLGMYDPQTKMYVVRSIHAIWSMIIVFIGYKIALRNGGVKAAKMSGWLLAILFFMPMMSVRNLVEFTCIPPLLIATWLVTKTPEDSKAAPLFVAGLMLSLAFSIRFQTLLFIGGFLLAMIIQYKWKRTFYTCLGLLTGLAIVQASTDILIWHEPFVELKEYIRYNIVNAENYNTQKWYNYLLLISGILVPPISLFLLFGFIHSWRKYLLLFLPTFVFFIFHSYFPNKQERFILPVIPFIIILGSIGWCNFFNESEFWKRNIKLYRSCWIFFIAINTIPLLFISVTYSHKSRVEAMVYLSQKKDLKNVLIEESNHDDYTMPPRFYLKNWKSEFYLTRLFPLDSLVERIKGLPPESTPNYVVFVQPENIGMRVIGLKKIFPHLTFETIIYPGFIDNVMFRLNKHNANFTSYIFKLGNPSIKVE